MYYKLNGKSVVKEDLLTLAKNASDSEWMLLRGFNVLPVPAEFIKRDPLLFALSQKFAIRPGLFKMDPVNHYTFHTDSARSVAINMLLEGPDSYTMFGEKTISHEVMKVDQLVYEDSSYYIFNTSKPHAVLNLSKNTRYLLTVGIVEPGIDYDAVKDFCIQQNL